ncbi:hypothetical protein ISS85_02115 [Candidatus Microgenomates bacterium]|nr:hypothetical protein [Candidatus Microgenomates bacterium]
MDQDQTTQNQTDDQVQPKPITQPQTGRGLGEKEKELLGPKEAAIETVGQELEPPKEVKKARVTLKKEEIQLPPSVEEMGVKPADTTAPPPTLPSTPLPLADDQVMRGLTKSPTSSWRWLAEFCLRQLKKLHIGLKKIQGKVVRVKS